MNIDATITDYCQRGPSGVVCSPIFIHDASVDGTILATFLSKLSEITPQDLPDVVTWDLNSKRSFHCQILLFNAPLLFCLSYGV